MIASYNKMIVLITIINIINNKNESGIFFSHKQNLYRYLKINTK